MKTLNFTKCVLVAACASMALTSVRATTVTLTVDPNFPPGTTLDVLGNVNPPEPASDADDVSYINDMITLSLGGTGNVGGDNVYRSQNSFGSLPMATTTGDVPADGTKTSFTMVAGYVYLTGKYDGPNGGLIVWDVAGIAAGTTIVIPQNAYGANNDQYGLSGTWFFDGTTSTNPPSAPDGGTTVGLLGIGLIGLAVLKRKLAN